MTGTRYDESTTAQELLAGIRAASTGHIGDVLRYNLGLTPLDDGKKCLVNVVLQGGGTLGVALLGFVRGLEEANILFAGAAGTSAGSIVALLMVAARGRVLPR